MLFRYLSKVVIVFSKDSVSSIFQVYKIKRYRMKIDLILIVPLIPLTLILENVAINIIVSINDGI